MDAEDCVFKMNLNKNVTLVIQKLLALELQLKEDEVDNNEIIIDEKPPVLEDLLTYYHRESRKNKFNPKTKTGLKKNIYTACINNYYDNREYPPIKCYLPNFLKNICRHLYEEKFRSIPLAEEPELITNLMNSNRILNNMQTLKHIIEKTKRQQLQIAINRVLKKSKSWYNRQVKLHKIQLYSYFNVAKKLLREEKEKYDRELIKYKDEAIERMEELAQEKLAKDIEELEDLFRRDLTIKAQLSCEKKYKTLKLNKRKLRKDCLEKLNKLQKNKLKLSLRAMAYCEVEHNQQIVEYVRDEFLNLHKTHGIKSKENAIQFSRSMKEAQLVNNQLKEKIDLNRNLYEHVNVCKSLVKELVKEIVKLLNYLLGEKKFDECLILAQFEGKVEEKSIQNEQSKSNYCLKIFTEESELDYRIQEGYEPIGEIESVLNAIIKNVIPSVSEIFSDPSNLLKYKYNKDMIDDYDIEGEEILKEEALSEKRQKETTFKLVGEEINVSTDDEILAFAKNRIDNVVHILNRNKNIIGSFEL